MPQWLMLLSRVSIIFGPVSGALSRSMSCATPAHEDPEHRGGVLVTAVATGTRVALTAA